MFNRCPHCGGLIRAIDLVLELIGKGKSRSEILEFTSLDPSSLDTYIWRLRRNGHNIPKDWARGKKTNNRRGSRRLWEINARVKA